MLKMLWDYPAGMTANRVMSAKEGQILQYDKLRRVHYAGQI